MFTKKKRIIADIWVSGVVVWLQNLAELMLNVTSQTGKTNDNLWKHMSIIAMATNIVYYWQAWEWKCYNTHNLMHLIFTSDKKKKKESLDDLGKVLTTTRQAIVKW